LLRSHGHVLPSWPVWHSGHLAGSLDCLYGCVTVNGEGGLAWLVEALPEKRPGRLSGRGR